MSFSYFSDEGIWLVYATNNSQEIPTFSNASLVLIDEDNDPKSYFYETVKYRLYDEWGNKLTKTTSNHFYILITEFLSLYQNT
ncbi:hypothetical protein HYE04_00935 [Mycoplasmopsis bovis]|nr:hypothetical protein [Mycoplasmopsis bovis]QQH27753.1 hypothetical protein HYE04_00935 [Mycoplasmopsis bovis]